MLRRGGVQTRRRRGGVDGGVGVRGRGLEEAVGGAVVGRWGGAGEPGGAVGGNSSISSRYLGTREARAGWDTSTSLPSAPAQMNLCRRTKR